MIQMISLKCPECRADLSVEDDRKECVCQYCGAKILIDDGATAHTYRKIDEARIKEAEVRFRELEMQEKWREMEEKRREMENELERKAVESRKKIRMALAFIGVFMILVSLVSFSVAYTSTNRAAATLMLFGIVLTVIAGTMSSHPKK